MSQNNECKTRKGQTAYELAKEFVDNAAKTLACDDSEIAATYQSLFMPFYLCEKGKRDLDKFEALITVNKDNRIDVRKLPFIERIQPKLSPYLMAWVSACGEGNPQYVTAVLGLYCIYFYHDHPRDEEITVKWLYSTIGSGKIFQYQDIFPYYVAAKVDNSTTIFDTITQEQVYTYQAE